jgi:hypothetical protein
MNRGRDGRQADVMHLSGERSEPVECGGHATALYPSAMPTCWKIGTAGLSRPKSGWKPDLHFPRLLRNCKDSRSGGPALILIRIFLLGTALMWSAVATGEAGALSGLAGRHRFGFPGERKDWQEAGVRMRVGDRRLGNRDGLALEVTMLPTLPLCGETKAASPGLLIKRRSPFAAISRPGSAKDTYKEQGMAATLHRLAAFAGSRSREPARPTLFDPSAGGGLTGRRASGRSP